MESSMDNQQEYFPPEKRSLKVVKKFLPNAEKVLHRTSFGVNGLVDVVVIGRLSVIFVRYH